MTDGQNFFHQPVRNDLRTYDNIRKFETIQSDYYTTDCQLHNNCFKEFSL